MKWFSNVLDTYGYLTGALTGRQQLPTAAPRIDGTLVPRPLREQIAAACRSAGDLLVNGLSQVSVRSGANQMIITAPEADFFNLAAAHLTVLGLGSAADDTGGDVEFAAVHQAIYRQSDHRAVIVTPAVFASVLAAHHRLPTSDLLEVALEIAGLDRLEDLLDGDQKPRGQGALISQVGLAVWGSTLDQCARHAAQIERWCQISWIGRELGLPKFN